jgi:serine/threonine-protein kinase
MKTLYGRPGSEPIEAQRIPKSEQKAAAGSGFGPDTVVTTAQRVTTRVDAGSAGDPRVVAPRAARDGSIALPTLRAEERLLLGLVDGRLSVRRLARLSGLPEEATLQHLQGLCERGVLVPVDKAEVTIVGKSGTPTVRLGPYEVAMRIARGGMGSVYLCRRAGSANFQRIYALKVVRQNSADQELAEESFKREVRVGALLSHPNLQSVVDVGTYQEQPYLVLDYVEGCSLEELTASGQRVPPGIVVSVLLDVLRGLQCAHDLTDDKGRALGLVHGDVSPPNIMVGVDGSARLADFGSARFTAQGESARRDTEPLGKPAYMAPEQLRGEALLPQTDIFAAGVVLWSALTGRELFAGESYEQIVENVLRGTIAPPSAYGAPACLDSVCMRALERSSEDRFRSADEMAHVLLRVAVTNDLIASPRSVGEYVRTEVGDTLLERRRKIEAAFQNAASAKVLQSDPVETTMVPQASVASDKDPKLSQTVLIPGREAATTKAKVVVRRPTRRRTAASVRAQRRAMYATVSVGVLLAAIILGFAFRIARAPRSLHRSEPPAAALAGTPAGVPAATPSAAKP